MFLFFISNIITDEIVLNIENYIESNLFDRYNIARINKFSYEIYKNEINRLKNSAYGIIHSYLKTNVHDIIFDKYLSIVIHQANPKFKNNLISGEYLDHIYDNNYIVIYINDRLDLIVKEFKNCYSIEVVSTSAADISVCKDYVTYHYILYDSYGIFHYELRKREAYTIGLTLSLMIRI